MTFEVPAGARGWLVIFHRRSTAWVARLCPGPWKHVSVVGFMPEARVWVALSWELGRLRVAVVPDADFETRFLPEWADEGAGVLLVRAPAFDTGPWRPRLGLGCAPMVAHVLGLPRGALFPHRLWRLLVANGAEIVTDGRPVQSEVLGQPDIVGRAGRPAKRRGRAA